MTHNDHDDDDEHVDGPAPSTDGGVEETERRLTKAGEPYVRATVVRREAPISATVGDRAIVTVGGIRAGWIGGVGCAETAVVRESKEVLASGEPTLIGLAPDPETVARPGLSAFPLTCHSGGTIEVFLEPVGTASRLLVVGGSEIANAVVAGAADLGFHVTVVDPADDPHPGADEVLATTDYRAIVEATGGAEAVVVASVGELDARGVAAAIELGAGYVGLVASRRRAEEVVERVAELLGVDLEDVGDRVQSPAGVDIGAETPAEIAVSILAELVRVRDSLVRDELGDVLEREGADDTGQPHGDHASTDGHDHETVVDPVCGMTIDPENAAATVEHEGVTYFFCGQGCADAFVERPEEYLGKA